MRALVAALAMLAGCDGATTGVCGDDGTVVSAPEGRYCVYAVTPGTRRAGEIRCPAYAPVRIELPQGIACSPAESSASDLPDEVCAVAGPGCGPAFAGPPLTWARIEIRPPAPLARYAAAAAYDGPRDRVVVHGGQTGPYDRPEAFGETWSLTIADGVGAWQRIEVESEPLPRQLASSVHDVERGRLIVLGGFVSEELGETWALDLETDRWSALPSFEVGRDTAAAAIGGGAIWLFGGSSANEVDGTSELLRFDLAEASWRLEQPTSDAPLPVLFPAIAYDGDGVWAAGGASAGIRSISHDVWRYDVPTRVWARQPVELDDFMAGPGSFHDADCRTLVLLGGGSTDDVTDAVRALRLRGSPEVVALPPMPEARAASAVAFDRARRRVIVFGGFDGETGTSDVFVGQLGACP